MIQDNFSLMNKVERAISDLSRGMPIIFYFDEKKYLVFSAELFSEEIFFSTLKKKNQFYNLIITNQKAKKIGIECKNNALLSVRFSEIINFLELNQNGKYRNINESFIEIYDDLSKYGILLMKELRLLPYIIVEEIKSGNENSNLNNLDLYKLDSNSIDKYFEIKNNKDSMREIARSKINLKNAENSEIIVFRDLPNFGKVHVMILIGEKRDDITPNIRIHSGCYTGDLLASLQCDCRDQLQQTIKYLSKEWKENEVYGGIVYQAVDEGRAIGLINKIRTYHLQNCSCNTIDANYEIGYEDDERDFISAANILKKMNINQCRLITNNPKKIDCLKEQSIEIIERVSVITKSNQYNQNYLNIKFSDMNHMNF
jgi:GTP cyclohydrolase II